MKKRFAAFDAAILILSVACVVLCVALALINPLYLAFAGGVLLVAALVVWLNLQWFRRRIARFLRGISSSSDTAQNSFASLKMPVAVLSGGTVVWYNDAFRDDVTQGQEVCLLPLAKVIPAIDPAQTQEKNGQNIEYGGQRYTVYGSGVESVDSLFVLYFVNNTVLRRQAGEYLATRPALMIIAVDTYDERVSPARSN